MPDIRRALKSDRIMKSLTGLTGTEFSRPVPVYEEIPSASAPEKERERAPGAGAEHSPETPEEKLFHILFCVKCYPTSDAAGFFCDADRSQPCRRSGMYLPLPEKAPGRRAVLPQRKIGSAEEFIRLFPEAEELSADGTERPVRRRKNHGQQGGDYPGEKKRHMRKNIVISDADKRIPMLSPAGGGRRHDCALFRESGIPDHLPAGQTVFTDTGFQGIRKDYPHLHVSIPYKKPEGRKLTFHRKMRNRIISSCRIVAENAVCGIERLKSLTDIHRNRRDDCDDLLMNIGCGLRNYHLSAA